MSNEPRKLARLEDRTLSTSMESNMTTETGGPAFPGVDYVAQNGKQNPEGMTLRDYFAAKAMHARLSTSLEWYDRIARESYEMADAMLKAREA